MFFTSVSIDSFLRNMWSFDVIRDAGAIEKLTWQNQLAMLDIDQLDPFRTVRGFEVQTSQDQCSG